MPTDPEALYLQLGRLVAEMPDLENAPLTPDVQRWLARAAHLVAETYGAPNTEHIGIVSASDNLTGFLRPMNAHRIATIVHRALARAEAKAPAAARGAFIPAGGAFDVLQSVGQVLSTAQHRVLIVDPYMDHKVLTDFAPVAREGVTVHLLSDREYTKPEALVPWVQRWHDQFKDLRPLLARQTPRKRLHDRYIFIDDAEVWSLSQSLKDFAGRSPATLTHTMDDTVPLKLQAYGQMWDEAKPLGE